MKTITNTIADIYGASNNFILAVGSTGDHPAGGGITVSSLENSRWTEVTIQ